jgi:predicted Zn-dependent protease
MHSSPGIEEVDIKGNSYCKKCMEQISRSKENIFFRRETGT